MEIKSDNPRDIIINALKNRKAENACPRCGHTDFTVSDGYTSLFIGRDMNSLEIGGRSIPVAIVICLNCGFVSLHALGALDLLPDQEKQDE